MELRKSPSIAPQRRNAFTPLTVTEMYDAFSVARDDASIGVIILTRCANHGGRHEDEAFCSGGDQKIRGNGGYVGEDNIPRLNVLDLQRLIRVVPKPVIAMVNGYAIGGGHVLHLLCDLSIAAETGEVRPDGSRRWAASTPAYGAGYLAKPWSARRRRARSGTCAASTPPPEALEMGHGQQGGALRGARGGDACRGRARCCSSSPTALRFMKASFNAATDGPGRACSSSPATPRLLYYTTDEAKEGRDAFKEKRAPDFTQVP